MRADAYTGRGSGWRREPGGYSAVADCLNRVFVFDPPVDRRQVYAWAKRRTRDGNGEPFPAGPPFSLVLCVFWVQAGGIPARGSRPGKIIWRIPQMRVDTLPEMMDDGDITEQRQGTQGDLSPAEREARARARGSETTGAGNC